jgi:poly(3-hydroxybutyrate) depolymerase
MNRRTATLCLLFSIGVTVNAQTAINLRGKVSDKTGKPVAGAIVNLVKQGLKDTTGTDGNYTISTATAVNVPMLLPENESVIPSNGGLAFSLSRPAAVRVQIFGINGSLLKKDFLPDVATGFYRFSVADKAYKSKLLIVKAAVGRTEMTFRCLPLSNGSSAAATSAGNSDMPANVRMAKLMAIDDTIKVTATGYAAKAVAIVSYEQQLDITIDSATPGSTGSIGCGKTLGSINKSGQYTIKVGGSNKTFRIRFPSNYDKANPYRLIFGMHCMGATSADIDGKNARSDGAYDYYRLGPLATNTIFVAPEGNSGGTWNGEPDHKFIDDLLKCLKDTLCIDTARVFSVGFSFGAMFTYTLSLNHQEQLRAVVCFAPANYSIQLPTNKKLPIAYMQTTGMSDGTCPWDQGGRGGKYCAITHAQDNGCDDPTTIATSSGQYKVHDFKGCDEGYPVKVVTWSGGHTAGESWMPQMAWDFIKQF